MDQKPFRADGLSTTLTTTAWWRVLRLRAEVSNNAGNLDDVQMSLYRAVHWDQPAPYSDPIYYGAITHPTATLAALMGRVAVRLGGGHSYMAAKAFYHLDQGMGGGKSHGLIGLYHMAHNPRQFFTTDIGQMVLQYAQNLLGGTVPRLEGTHVVIISADNMTPLAPDDRPEMDGPARTLWERFLWRLIGRDYNHYIQFKDRWDQEGIRDALRSVGRPVLILIDEIMDYVRQLDGTRYDGVRQSEFAFLKALFDAVNDVPHVAMVVVMIATDRDKAVYEKEAQNFREELLANMVRNGSSTAVTEAGDFSDIIRRRLFEEPAPEAVVAATAAAYTDVTPQWATILKRVPGYDRVTFANSVARSYPFNPDLLRLVETEWASLAGYQRVRSTVTLFAQTVYTWMEYAKEGRWAPPLIGVGDIPLEQSAVREALLGSGVIESEATVANYRQIIANDIVSENGRNGIATRLDSAFAQARERWAVPGINSRAAQRMATALLLYSLAPRSSGKIGATEPEVLSASFVPNSLYAATDAETVFNALRDQESGLGTLDTTAGVGGSPARYHLTTRQTLQMLFRMQRNAVADKDKDAQVLLMVDKEKSSGGGFSKSPILIENETDERGNKTITELLSGIDESFSTRLVVLDPYRWTLLNGDDEVTRTDIRNAFGIGPDPLPVAYAASLVIACANTQRRYVARRSAADYLAWTRVVGIQMVQDDSDLKVKAEMAAHEAREILRKDVRRAFQHYAYLVRDINGNLAVRFDKFDDDNKASYSGPDVWEQLAKAGRAVRPGTLTTEGFMLAIERELPRTLVEITRLFWTNPRLPMLSRQEELKLPLLGAFKQGRLEWVNNEGIVQAPPDRESNIPLMSPSITIRLPATTTDPSRPPDEAAEGLWSQTVNTLDTGQISPGNFTREPGGGTYETDNGSTPQKGADPDGQEQGTPAVVRTKLWLKTQSALIDRNRRESIASVLRRLANLAELHEEDMESMAFTMDIIGNKDALQDIVKVARQIEGTQSRFDDLPD